MSIRVERFFSRDQGFFQPFPRAEDWKVGTPGEVHYQWLVEYLRQEIILEPLADLGCLDPHDRIGAGVISGRSVENGNPNLLLADRRLRITESAFGEISKKLPQARRLGKRFACCYAVD